MTTEAVPNPVAVQKPTDMSETAGRSIDGEWTRSDTASESINPDCLAFCSTAPGALDLLGRRRNLRPGRARLRATRAPAKSARAARGRAAAASSLVTRGLQAPARH